jgi:hypothetical protein
MSGFKQTAARIAHAAGKANAERGRGDCRRRVLCVQDRTWRRCRKHRALPKMSRVLLRVSSLDQGS